MHRDENLTQVLESRQLKFTYGWQDYNDDW